MILTKNGNLLRLASGYAVNAKIKEVDPYNPLNLPPFTIRGKFRSGYTPSMGDSQTLVDSVENIWDITKNSTDWSGLFAEVDIRSVLGANSTGVTNMSNMFYHLPNDCQLVLFDTTSVTNFSSMFTECYRLTSIPLYDTSAGEIMTNMISYCLQLTIIPLFNTTSCIDAGDMCMNCQNIETGALALYQQMSTQATPPISHGNTFWNCGINTVTGAAELAQIPTSWGGTAS